MGPKGEKIDAAFGVTGDEVAVELAESGVSERYASNSSWSSAVAVGERIKGRLILLYDQARVSRVDASAVWGRSKESGGDSVSDGRLGGSWNDSSGSCSGTAKVCVNDGLGSGGGGLAAGGREADFGRAVGSGAEDIRLLFRRTSSASSLLTGEEDRKIRLGLGFAGSNNAIASETGTLLDVVWLKSSSKWAISVSGRTASSSRTWSTDDRDR